MIRNYLPDDRQELLQLFRLNTPEAFHPSEGEYFVKYLENEIEDYFVFEEKKMILGCGGINYSEHNTGVISWDMIHPAYHGQGIGRKLMEHRLTLLTMKKIYQVNVRTSQIAYKFYQKLGFELQSVKKDGWAPGFDIYQMQLILQA